MIQFIYKQNTICFVLCFVFVCAVAEEQKRECESETDSDNDNDSESAGNYYQGESSSSIQDDMSDNDVFEAPTDDENITNADLDTYDFDPGYIKKLTASDDQDEDENYQEEPLNSADINAITPDPNFSSGSDTEWKIEDPVLRQKIHNEVFGYADFVPVARIAPVAPVDIDINPPVNILSKSSHSPHQTKRRHKHKSCD